MMVWTETAVNCSPSTPRCVGSESVVVQQSRSSPQGWPEEVLHLVSPMSSDFLLIIYYCFNCFTRLPYEYYDSVEDDDDF